MGKAINSNNFRFLSSNTIASVTAEKAAGATTTLTISPVGLDILKEGDELIVVTSFGYNATITLAGSVGATDTTIRFSSVTFPFVIPVSSRIIFTGKNTITQAKSKRLYTQQSLYLTAGTNGNDYLSAFGTSTFSINSATTLADGNSKPNRWAAQFSIFVAPEDCTLERVRGWSSTDAGSGEDATIKIWNATPNANSTSNLTINLVTSFSISSQNNQNHLFSLNTALTSGNDFTAGDILFVSIQRSGNLNGSVKWYADIGFDFKMVR
tara:strand:- start:236 stop:1036 length:801 start_codon:yes stop_codon:yes gene_type:complete